MTTEVEEFVGHTDALAQWFITPNDVSQLHQDFEREMVLSQITKFISYGVHEKTVVIRTLEGRVMMTFDGDLVWIHYAPKGRWELLKFWMNRSSVRDIGQSLRAAPEKRATFDEIFFRW